MVDLTESKIEVLSTVSVVNEKNESVDVALVEERPLTIYVDKKEVLTLMTMGCFPELLILGYLKKPNFF